MSEWVEKTTGILIIAFSILLFFGANFLGIVLGIIIGMIIYGIILKPIDRIKNGKKRKTEAVDYLSEVLPPLQNRIRIMRKCIMAIQQSAGTWAVDIVGENLFNSENIGQLIEIVKSRRADTLKEALNKYDSTEHTSKMEEMQRAIQNATEIADEESVKQTVYAEETAKSSHEAATAAKATAYHTRKMERDTRQIKRNTR